MTTAAIRQQLAARGIAFESPYGCRWCGDERHHHGSQWAPIVGLHQWMEPDPALILERMRRRGAARVTAPPEPASAVDVPEPLTEPRAHDWDETPTEAAAWDRRYRNED